MSVAPVSAAPAGLGPETAVGEPVNGYVGRLDVSPEHAPAGTPVTVMAERLPPGQEFQLVWVTAIGTWKVTDTEYHGRDFTPVAYEIARVRTDSSGRFAAEPGERTDDPVRMYLREMEDAPRSFREHRIGERSNSGLLSMPPAQPIEYYPGYMKVSKIIGNALKQPVAPEHYNL
jgi:hypothetical protein